MDKYTKAILDVLKEKYTNIVGEKEFQNTSEAREFYLKHLDDNLYIPMSVGANASYGQGSGSEIESGKMNALRSSSAMTYNLFWDQIAEVSTGDGVIGSGVYQVEFEKQFHTLKPEVSRFPANLDAFLYCKHTKAAIACEMKMTEWIFNKPGVLKAAYLEPQNYIEEAGDVFVEIAEELILHNDYEDPDVKKTDYPGRFLRYDAFQMFKHAVACYTACVKEEPREIKKLTLINCIWTLNDVHRLPEDSQKRYHREENEEIEDFEQFKKIMAPIKGLYAARGIDFDIYFYTFADFLALFNKTQEEMNYLERYL